ncbi:hypothetical protein ES708_13938 [subsurface metagenome]
MRTGSIFKLSVRSADLMLILITLLCVSSVSAELPEVNDGLHHGDPPYLLEQGWMPLINGSNLDGWEYMEPDKGEWGTTSGVFWGGSENPQLMKAVPGPGDRLYNNVRGTNSASNMYTSQKFGDAELYLEFMVAEGSNSGVYLQGLYEIQIWDSFGKDLSDQITDICGAVYNYDQRVDNRYVGGVAPLERADRPSGQWQSYHIWFQSPKFDASGKKTANAKFLRVLHNGVLIHENIERVSPTRAPMNIPEAAMNPLMLQGDHGAIAYRNVYIRPLRRMTR